MKRFAPLFAVALLALALIVPSAAAAAPVRNQLLSGIPVTGALSDGGSFAGNLTLTSITRAADGTLQFAGNLTGLATDAAGDVTAVDQDFTAAVGSLTGGQPGKCAVLHLDLGPIFLDLLGLQVDLSEIVLNVDAVPGPGNLLGNLLCAVTHLLDGGPLSALDTLLGIVNRLLG